MNKENMIRNIIEKSESKIAISKFINEEKNKFSFSKILKTAATIVLTLGIGSGLVYATGAVVYEKIWKEPEEYKATQNLTDEEKSKCITEQEAEEIANNFLKKIGFDEQTIQNLNLYKDFIKKENIWKLNSEKVTMEINAENGEIKFVNIPTYEYKIPSNYGITREQARKVALELLEKYKPENYDGEYELVNLTRNSENDKSAYIWYADFYKKYDDLINPEEEISIGWIPTINALYSLRFENIKYENNEQKISKEDAIKIATEKDNQIEKNKEIAEVKAEIRIRKMNEKVYLRENYKEEYEKNPFYDFEENAILYKTEERVRKVWCVVITYSGKSGYTYYIDCTTGEIIGGNIGDELHNEETLKNDENNVIEK